MLVIGAIATAIGIPVALAIPWFPAQASAQSHKVDTLYDVLLIASVPIFVLVETVVLYSVWKFRMRPGEEQKDGPPIHGNTRLEVVWTAAPAILIVSLCTYAYTVLRSTEKSHKGEMTVDVIGEQFAWMFSYPQGGGQAVVSPELRLAKDQPVVFKVHSRDVIHAFWVPQFREQLDAVPGITGTVRVTPTRTGNYQLVCAELCGNGHSLMRATVRVMPSGDFRSWLATQPRQPQPSFSFAPPAGGAGAPAPPAAGAPPPASSPPGGGAQPAPPPPAASPSAAAGKAVFTGPGGCGSCHTLADAGTTGTTGPDLGTRLVPDAKKRGLPLKQFIFESITKPNAFIAPGYPPNVMPPNFPQILSPTQIQALVDYLASVTK
jgi:cytochrome c oxidase subunit 2